MIVDYHMHLRAPDESLDHTVEGVERFVEAAAARGLDEIGFTEHVYYFAQTRSLWTVPSHLKHCTHDMGRYVGAVTEAKRRGIAVKLGLNPADLRLNKQPTAQDTKRVLAGDVVAQQPSSQHRIGLLDEEQTD